MSKAIFRSPNKYGIFMYKSEPYRILAYDRLRDGQTIRVIKYIASLDQAMIELENGHTTFADRMKK